MWVKDLGVEIKSLSWWPVMERGWALSRGVVSNLGWRNS